MGQPCAPWPSIVARVSTWVAGWPGARLAPTLETMTLATFLQEPELRPFLPLLYLAWADGDLGPEERQIIRARVDAQPWLKPRLRLELERWLTSTPPDAVTLARLRAAIVSAVGTLSSEGRRSLVAVAASMASLDPATRAALDELERSLGLSATGLAILQDTAAAPTPLIRFDVARVQALLDGRFAATRDRARAFLDRPEERALYGVDSGTHRAKVFASLGALAREGFGALAFPGVTSDARDGLGPFLVAFETLGYGDLSLAVKFGVQFGLWGGSIYFLGSDEQRARYLPQVASLEAPGCFAMSEVGHGSNVADLETVVRWVPKAAGRAGHFVLHTPAESARKDWAGNVALHARHATVFAQLEIGEERHGVHAFVVPIRDERGEALPGIRLGDVGHKLGLNGVDNGRIWFDEVEIERDALLSRYAEVTPEGEYRSPIESPSRRFFTMLGTLVGGRIAVATSGLSAAKVGLAIALRYASARRQFGAESAPETLLLDYPTHQRRLFPHLAATYAFHFALDRVRERFLARHEGDDTRELEAEVAGLKAGATWHVTATLQACREACGGQGYLSVNRLGDAKSDTDVFTTFEGDNTVLMQLLAKGLLTGFRQTLAERGLARVVASQLLDAAALKNPITSRDTSDETLRDADHQLALLSLRETSLLQSAARRVQKRIAAKADPGEAASEVQEHLVALAGAHVDLLGLRAFVDAVASTGGAEREVLDRLRTLHGLCLLERHTAWFLENGVFESGPARAIRRLVPRLFAELRPDVVALTAAFGIPDHCLAAPIAFQDPAHPRW